MKNFTIGLLLILVFFSHELFAAEYKINPVPSRPSCKPMVTVNDEGDLFILYYGNDDVLYIIKNRKQTSKIYKEGFIGQFIWLGFPDGKPSVIWRPKSSETGDKFIYLQKADKEMLGFEKEIVINSAKDALLPIKVEWHDKKVYVYWVDERQIPMRMHMNYSTDGGMSFRKEDIDLTPEHTSILGKIVIGDKRMFFFFLGKKEDDEHASIYVQTSENGTKWSEPVTLATCDEWTPAFIEGLMTPKGPLGLWAGPRGIRYAYLNDNGTWDVQSIKQTEDMNVNIIKVIPGNDGLLYLITSYRERLQKIKKPSVYFFTSNDYGETWSEPIRINHNKYDNTKATVPDMYVTDKGTIVVVWQDHRLIRGNIYMNYSKDGGMTWLPEDINLNDNPGKNNDFFPFITGYKDKVYVVFPRYKDDSVRGEFNIYLKEVNFSD